MRRSLRSLRAHGHVTPRQSHATTIVVLAVAVGLTLYVTSLVLVSVVWLGGGTLDATETAVHSTGGHEYAMFQLENRTSVDPSYQFSQRALHSSTEDNVGIVSLKNVSFFRSIQEDIDRMDPVARCARYGGRRMGNATSPRRLFYGALIASEPWELLHIVAAESYGIYTGLVLVESNRTPNFTPRPWRWVHPHNASHSETLRVRLATLFGIRDAHMVQIRPFLQEDATLLELDREHAQRAEILRGWQSLRMTPDDVGVLGDLDETFTRDVLRAVQTCASDTFPMLDYPRHQCHHLFVKLSGYSRIYEASPYCTPSKTWYHPDMILGHCIQGIGNVTRHGVAPRAVYNHPTELFWRAPGHGQVCTGDWSLERNLTYHPLWNAADFRRTCSGPRLKVQSAGAAGYGYEPHTAYHFHNFFGTAAHVRFKYTTYAHAAAAGAVLQPMENVSHDLHFAVQCAHEMNPGVGTTNLKLRGGVGRVPLFTPVYFYDADYQRRRHAHVQQMLLEP